MFKKECKKCSFVIQGYSKRVFETREIIHKEVHEPANGLNELHPRVKY